MKVLDQKTLLYLKKNHFTEAQKTYCKKFEQTSGQFDFFINGVKYLFKHDGSRAYSDFVQSKLKHRGGIMNRGAGPLAQDKYNKINHTENNLIKKIDKTIK
jgi:hypothetical protein|tara:strand:- start:154 stop:456 length:303 start_codon:yes stop_codon:yes gene_type:complete